MNLPDAEGLCQELVRKLRSGVTASTGATRDETALAATQARAAAKF